MMTNENQQTQVKTIHFFNKIKIIKNHTNTNKKHLTIHLIIIHQMMTIFMTKTINKILKTKDSSLITYINQIFLNHIHKNNICDNLDQITNLKIIIFTHKIQQILTIINQHKCKTKDHYHIINNNMK